MRIQKKDDQKIAALCSFYMGEVIYESWEKLLHVWALCDECGNQTAQSTL